MKKSDLQNIIDDLRKLEKITHGRMGDWIYQLECANSLWLRSPYKIGDRVVLTKTPVINEKEAYGWMGSQHFLIAGALATVAECEFYAGMFRFGLHFDNESWVDRDGQKHPIDSPSMYMFGESYLAPAPKTPEYVQLSCEAL